VYRTQLGLEIYLAHGFRNLFPYNGVDNNENIKNITLRYKYYLLDKKTVVLMDLCVGRRSNFACFKNHLPTPKSNGILGDI